MIHEENSFKAEKSRTAYNNAVRRLMDRFPCWDCSRLGHSNGGLAECAKAGKCMRNLPERKAK